MVSKEPFYQYVDGVLSGKEVVGKLITQAVERFIGDVDRGDFFFDYEEGKRIVNFAGLCNHWKGPKAGSPIVFEPHQHFYFIQKYGWKEKDTGLPRFTRTYKEIARKQYKTTECGIESIFHVMKGVDHAAQVWTCATKEDDAVILVNDAGRIIESTPHLKKKFKLRVGSPYITRVAYPERQAFIAFMTKGQDAVDTSMGFGDECHDWPNADVKQRITSSMGNRLAPSFTNVTTAGFDKSSYCFQDLRAGAIRVLDRTMIDERQLVIMYELDDDDDWKDESKWIKANPNLPYSKTHLRYLKEQFIEAVNKGGTTEVNFKTKNLNMWVDAPSIWIQDEVWKKNTVGMSESDLGGQTCYGGLHFLGSSELNAFAFIFPNIRDGLHAVKVIFWMPEGSQIDSYIMGDFERWTKAGFIKTESGNTFSNSNATDILKAEISKYQMHSFSCSNSQISSDIVQGLAGDGYVCNPISQRETGYLIPTTNWGDLLTSNQIEHFANPVLNWMNSNCSAVKKGDSVKVEQSRMRTVGIFAAINAVAQWKTIEGNETDDKTIGSW